MPQSCSCHRLPHTHAGDLITHHIYIYSLVQELNVSTNVSVRASRLLPLRPRYYETALQQLILMQSRPQLTRLARQHMMASDTGSLRKQHLTDGWADQVAEEAALLLAQEKYNYVVSRWVVPGCGSAASCGPSRHRIAPCQPHEHVQAQLTVMNAGSEACGGIVGWPASNSRRCSAE